MIIFDLIYLSIFSFFKRILNKYSFDTPETAALGVLGFIIGLSLHLLYYHYFHTSFNYSKKIGGWILGTGVALSCVGFYFRYIPKEKYNKLYKKYKSYLLIPGVVVIVWSFVLLWQMKNIYFKI